MDVICAVEAPVGVDTSLFPFEHEGEAYAAAVWTLSKSGFTNAGKTILTARAMFLRDGYRTGKWQVTSAKRQGPKGIYYVPAFRASGKTDEALTLGLQMPAFSRHVEYEPMVIGYLVGLACRGTSLNVIGAVLERTLLTDAQRQQATKGIGRQHRRAGDRRR